MAWYCPDREVELILWCRNRVPVYKREHFFKDGAYDSVTDEYSDWLDWTWRTPWECGATNFDYEKLVLCETSTWNKVLVESWTDTSDPLQARTTRYTYLATNSPFTWNADTDLSDCGWEKLDIQTKQYCDTWETVFGTLVFDVSWTSAVLIGIVFHKVDWSVHTPVSPVEWACIWSAPVVITSEAVAIWSALTPPALWVYAVISIVSWEWVVTVDWTTPAFNTVWHQVFEQNFGSGNWDGKWNNAPRFRTTNYRNVMWRVRA